MEKPRRKSGERKESDSHMSERAKEREVEREGGQVNRRASVRASERMSTPRRKRRANLDEEAARKEDGVCMET